MKRATPQERLAQCQVLEAAATKLADECSALLTMVEEALFSDAISHGNFRAASAVLRMALFGLWGIASCVSPQNNGHITTDDLAVAGDPRA